MDNVEEEPSQEADQGQSEGENFGFQPLGPDPVEEATKKRKPFEIIYYEACLNQQGATHREKY